MASFGWLLLVGGGPVLLAIAFLYAFMRARRLTPTEKVAQEEKVEELYNEKEN